MKKMIVNASLLILSVIISCFIAGVGCWCLGTIIEMAANGWFYHGLLEYVCTYYYDDNMIVTVLVMTMLGSFFTAKVFLKFLVKELAKKFVTSYRRMKLDRQVKWLV